MDIKKRDFLFGAGVASFGGDCGYWRWPRDPRGR